MEAKQNIAANDQEKFEPPMEWAREDAIDTLVVYLPGFSREKLKIQITSTKNLRISGERSSIGGTKRRFEKEFPIPSNCDTNAISANFVEGILYVKLPKTITPAPKSAPEKQPKPTHELPSYHPQQPKTTYNGQEDAADQQAPKTKSTMDQATTDHITSSRQEKEPISDSGKEMESDDFESKKISSSAAAENGASYVSHKTMKEDKNKGLVDMEKKRMSPGTVDGKLVDNATKRDERGKMVAARGGETRHGTDIGKGGSRLEGLDMVVQKPKRLINLVVGLLFVVMFALFVKDTIFKLLKGESKRAEL